MIMTGTPSGVAAFRNPLVWLDDVVVVEVEVEGMGRIKNKMTFKK